MLRSSPLPLLLYSGPLSMRIFFGLPRRLTRCVRTQSTRLLGRVKSDSTNNTSRLASSIKFKLQNFLPLSKESCVKSIDQQWLSAGGTSKGSLIRAGRRFLTLGVRVARPKPCELAYGSMAYLPASSGDRPSKPPPSDNPLLYQEGPLLSPDHPSS